MARHGIACAVGIAPSQCVQDLGVFLPRQVGVSPHVVRPTGSRAVDKTLDVIVEHRVTCRVGDRKMERRVELPGFREVATSATIPEPSCFLP